MDAILDQHHAGLLNTNWLTTLLQAESEPLLKVQGSAETYYLSKYTQAASAVCPFAAVSGTGKKLIPNTLYYLSLKSYDKSNNAATLPATWRARIPR